MKELGKYLEKLSDKILKVNRILGEQQISILFFTSRIRTYFYIKSYKTANYFFMECLNHDGKTNVPNFLLQNFFIIRLGNAKCTYLKEFYEFFLKGSFPF